MQGEGENAKPVSRSPQELAQLKQMVVNALGVANNGMLAEVSIQEIPFKVESSSAPVMGPSFVDNLAPWMEFLRPVGGLMLAALIFLVFLRLIKKYKSESVNFERLNEANSQKPESGFDFENTPLTPESLTQLIQQKPENISLAFKNWVSSENK
jgi:flagellar biosynthesis/type III secretory pathway M-ring protein FliF/YscJ